MVDRFIARFGQDQIAVIHSKLSIGERFDAWNKIVQGKVKIVIGARSAIFAPIKNLGVIREGGIADLIIVDVDNIHNLPNGEYDLALVYSTQAQDVDTVIVDGKILMKDKQLLTIDEEMVKYKIKEVRNKLKIS